MERIQVQSSSVAEVGYDPQAKILEVAFHKGDEYRYFDVPMSVYHDLLSADSLGKFLNLHVRNNYRYAKL